ncbi:MAG: phycobilisome protein [Coleofasciculaceae cyanobacterium]
MKLTNSDKIKELISKARIVSFANCQDSFSSKVISIFQQADAQGRYLTDADLEQIQTLSPEVKPLTDIVKILRNQADEIVSEARQQVLTQYPDLTEPGGGLYPPERAEACWRDFWHFLRCITYGIASGQTQFTCEEGLHYMNLLYQELQVPIPAMVLGLESTKDSSLQRLSDDWKETLEPYFEHLIGQLRLFSYEHQS